MITKQEELTALVARLLKEPIVAIDTEFLWEDTYYPILGLVQVATADGASWLIDPVTLGDIHAFGAVLAAPGVIKLLHDAQQDLTILYHATGALPKNSFDTRLAAGFAGLDSTCSLKKLLEQLLDLHLAKTETRSDWTRRPLSPEQLGYAAEDVVYLPKARELLIARCASDEVRSWLAEEQARYDDAALYAERAPEEMFTRVKGAHGLRPRALAVLRSLAAWRETEARTRDWPRSHIVPDEALLSAAEEQPRDAESFLALKFVSCRMPREVAVAAVEAIGRGIAVPETELPSLPSRTAAERREMKPRADAVLKHIAEVAATYKIDPALVASRRDVENYLFTPEAERASLSVTQGWRKRFFA